MSGSKNIKINSAKGYLNNDFLSLRYGRIFGLFLSKPGQWFIGVFSTDPLSVYLVPVNIFEQHNNLNKLALENSGPVLLTGMLPVLLAREKRKCLPFGLILKETGSLIVQSARHTILQLCISIFSQKNTPTASH